MGSRALLVIVALLISATLAAEAQGNLYPFTQDGRITSRKVPYLDHTGTAQTALDFGYKGPKVIVGGSSTNKDTYSCPIAGNYFETFSSYVGVSADYATSDLNFGSSSDIYFRADWSYIGISTTNWSRDDADIRVVASCTPDGSVIGYTGASGDYLKAWLDSLFRTAGTSREPDYAGLVRNAFSWGAATARASSVGAIQAARKPGNRFALRNGANTLTLRFNHPPRTRRPPAIYLSTRPANAACRTTRLQTTVNDGAGSAQLGLRCRGLSRGATAQLKIRRAIRRTFRLRAGKGSVRVRLRKPPGSVEPLVHVSARPAKTPCKVRRHRVRLARATFTLRLDGHCGRVKRGAVGEIAVGGLLAER